MTDTATLTGGFNAGGQVTYRLFKINVGTCTGSFNVTSVVTVTNGVVPNSRAVLFNATGTYSWNAVYTGDTNNMGTTSQCEPMTVIPTPPQAAQPVFVQMQWLHKVSLANPGNLQGFAVPPATQDFIVGIYNNDSTTTIYAKIIITGQICGDGSHNFRVESTVYAIAPKTPLMNVHLRVVFTPSDVGVTFCFNGKIQWGTSPASMNFFSTKASEGLGFEDFDTSNSAAGTFTVVP